MEATLTPSKVRQLAAEARVRPHVRYHAFDHHVLWWQIESALVTCYKVSPDLRLHAWPPEGPAFLAWGYFQDRRILRVDFELGLDEEDLILVVTAFEEET